MKRKSQEVKLGGKPSAGNRPMRVYFAPCGIGLGHVGRCMPIAKRLQEQKVQVIFSTYREGIPYIQREKFPLFKAPPIGFQVKPDGTIDFKQTAINPGPFFASFTLMKQVNAELYAIESFNPDIVVSDSRASTMLAAKILRKPRICILNQFQPIIPRKKRFLRLARFADSIALTLIGKVWTSGDTVLIPDFPPPYTVCAGNLNIPRAYQKRVHLIGPILPVHPEKLPDKKEIRKRLNIPQNKPLIFAPISGSVKEKAFFIGILRKILMNFPRDYEIILSMGYPNADSNPVCYGNLTIYKWIPNRFEYLKACDLVIGRAGHGTITQCMCYGKPMILVPTPNHTEQLNNAVQAKKIGVAKVIQQENLSLNKLLITIKQALTADNLERIKQIQAEVLRYDGLENAVKMIFEAANKS
ncbi:MAG: UDP-N-acetylglucosamine--N-acetylmuramyl-(pentapeptide) pyrophosphoryl-undecaprenol N-acetylglucosamine transferase [Candidatus Bathyarchaeia archaeon]